MSHMTTMTLPVAGAFMDDALMFLGAAILATLGICLLVLAGILVRDAVSYFRDHWPRRSARLSYRPSKEWETPLTLAGWRQVAREVTIQADEAREACVKAEAERDALRVELDTLKAGQHKPCIKCGDCGTLGSVIGDCPWCKGNVSDKAAAGYIREALGNGADEEAWPPGVHWAEAACRIIQARRDSPQGLLKKLRDLDAKFRFSDEEAGPDFNRLMLSSHDRLVLRELRQYIAAASDKDTSGLVETLRELLKKSPIEELGPDGGFRRQCRHCEGFVSSMGLISHREGCLWATIEKALQDLESE